MLVQISTTRLWVYVEGRFPSCVCPSQWYFAGRCRRSKFGCVIFSGQFFLRGAFMLCNVWDVLATLQRWDCKFFLNCGGPTNTDTNCTTRAHKLKNPLKKARPTCINKKQSCESLVVLQGHLLLGVGAIMIPPPACEGTKVGAEVASQPVAWKPLFLCITDGDSNHQTAKTAGGESPPPSSALFLCL